MSVTLTVTAGPHAGQAYVVEGHQSFLVGRSRRADFWLPLLDKCMSRVHFVIEVNPPHVGLTDLGSTNGTFVNGEAVEPGKRVLLADGDTIEAGVTVLAVAVRPGQPDTLETVGPSLIRDGEPDTPAPSTVPLDRPDFIDTRCRACEAAPRQADWLCRDCESQAGRCEQSIAGYRIVRELGKGGMGVVYVAVRESDGFRAAIKTIKPVFRGAKGHIERFLREARILRQLDHPRIVAVRDVGESGGLLYFVMDYVPGTDAGHLLQQNGPLPVGRACGLVRDLLDGLVYAHAEGFVHRDVKPSNLLIDKERRGVLSDFGLARCYEPTQMSGLSRTGEPGGTPGFMAPEQVLNFRDAKPQADVYAACGTLYHLLTGEYVLDFPQAFHAQMRVLLEGQPVPIRSRRPDLPPKLADWIHRGLSRKPDERPTASDLRDALAAFCG